MERDVFSGRSKLHGEEHEYTLIAAHNYASSLNGLERYAEVKALLRRTVPVARRVLGENREYTLTMRWIYAEALYKDAGATLDDLSEAVRTLVEIEPTARRVLGGAHPTARMMVRSLRNILATLRARETPPRES